MPSDGRVKAQFVPPQLGQVNKSAQSFDMKYINELRCMNLEIKYDTSIIHPYKTLFIKWLQGRN